MLCYDLLCYAVLCYAVLCYAMLRYAMLCYAMQCTFRFALLCCAVREIAAERASIGVFAIGAAGAYRNTSLGTYRIMLCCAMLRCA